ncbi:unnamed protein product [Bursaphelenchus xylophilus]|uniref:(pine wood nematode) hypothetical protein n=1 Tax=Bursaphelenchus xylophilus TaxID=6326 RepID=A0A811LES3_BURXY|nr:unnamed protein product [Bursaphelenchus xylophilus]CAG9116071.1 unnamed protein product [Bursaphelenchus xylophilus]
MKNQENDSFNRSARSSAAADTTMDSGSSGNDFQKSAYVFESGKQYQPGPVSSSYAFEREFPALSNYQAYLPEKKHSQYELESIRNYPAGEYSNYHYVKAEELSPLHQPTAKAEIFTKKDLLRRVEQLDSGFYQPVITCGQLHFVSSGNDTTHTARSSISEAEFNDLNTAISERSLRTAKSKANSVATAKLAGSEVNLNRALLNVKRITPDDIGFLIQIPGFRESLAQFKNDRKARKYRRKENEQLTTGISASRESILAPQNQGSRQLGTLHGDLKTARQASSTSLGNLRTGRERSASSVMQFRTARDVSSPSIRQVRTGREASLSNLRTGRQNSQSGLQTPPVSPTPRRHISRFESSQLQTGRQNSLSDLIQISGLRTGRERSSSGALGSSKPVVDNRSGRGQGNSSVKTGSAVSSRSPSVTTSTRSASQPRSRRSKSSASQRQSRPIPSQQANVTTAIEKQSLILTTGRSPSTSSMRTALDCESSKDVATALLPSSEDDRQLFESLNELNSVAARELRTPAAELTARECASVTEQMQRSAVHDVLHTPRDFDRRASESAANLGASLEHRIISDDSDIRTAQASESFH